MTWKEFKDQVEAQGINDFTKIVEINWRGRDIPEVRIDAVSIE